MDSLNGYPRFINDTAVTRQEEFSYTGEVTDAWSIGGVANGGYSMSIAARALSDCLNHKDPLSITGHYLSRAEPGPVTLKIEKLSEGQKKGQHLLLNCGIQLSVRRNQRLINTFSQF